MGLRRWIPRLYWRGAPWWARLAQIAALVMVVGLFTVGRDLDQTLRRLLAVLALAGWVAVHWRRTSTRGGTQGR